MNGEQRQALDRFREFGANLRPDFTHDELRTAFRSLALCFHPDRHPGLGAHEKARLSATFAQIKSAYEHLKRAA